MNTNSNLDNPCQVLEEACFDLRTFSKEQQQWQIEEEDEVEDEESTSIG